MITGRRALKWLLYLAGLCVTVLVTIVLVFAFQARVRLADLRPWHEISLASEFHARSADAPKTFVEYRALEDRLFAELRRKVLDDPASADKQVLGRYTPGSIPDPSATSTAWNAMSFVSSSTGIVPAPSNATLNLRGRP